jgi:ribosomal 50S subunit-recycling heat shock protein
VRLDKFLQVSRLVKRRTMANRLCDAGRVTLNGHRAKPAADVEVGARIGVDFGTRQVVARVLRIPAGRPSFEPIIEIVQDQRVGNAW